MSYLYKDISQFFKLDTLMIRPISLVKFFIYVSLILAIYYASLGYLLNLWNREDFSYCYFIPFIVIYLILEKRKQLIMQRTVSSWQGLIVLGLGTGCFWIGELGGDYLSFFISLWLTVIGLCWLHLGWRKLKQILFPLLIALAMFPPPEYLYNKLSVKLKLMSSKLGVKLIQLYGTTAFREGNMIDLGTIQLQIVDACNGIRYLFPLAVLGILLAYFARIPWWKKTILIISTAPLTIVTNSFRIALTGILSDVWGPQVAEGFFHGFAGWFIFMSAFAVLLLEMRLLSNLFADRSLSADASGPKAQPGPTAVATTRSGIPTLSNKLNNHGIPGWKALWYPPQFVIAVILLGTTLVLAQSFDFRQKIPINNSFDKFPLQVREWRGKSQNLMPSILDELDLSDYILVNYQNPSGQWVNFYTAYYESQQKGESIHSPATCLPSSGWIFKEAGNVKIAVQHHPGGRMPVKRAVMEKDGRKQLSYYWFPQRGRILTNAYQLKIYAFWDAINRQRTDGALVRLITPVYVTEDLADADLRLQAFTRMIIPVLNEFLPD